jgi:hypothetical protein
LVLEKLDDVIEEPQVNRHRAHYRGLHNDLAMCRAQF